ncbi:hypothetical protein BH11PSE1_BH11PSE1_20820 [soil metagenome]
MPVADDQKVRRHVRHESGDLDCGLARPQLGNWFETKFPQPCDPLFEHVAIRVLLVGDCARVHAFGQPYAGGFRHHRQKENLSLNGLGQDGSFAQSRAAFRSPVVGKNNTAVHSLKPRSKSHPRGDAALADGRIR